jgi:hypothetical protein
MRKLDCQALPISAVPGLNMTAKTQQERAQQQHAQPLRAQAAATCFADTKPSLAGAGLDPRSFPSFSFSIVKEQRIYAALLRLRFGCTGGGLSWSLSISAKSVASSEKCR